MNVEGFKIALQLMGGLALFIYGMNFMSEGLQKAAGEKMKSILAMLTRNVFIGVLAGAAATAVLQSSGAVTVMVIGFVSANLMTLRQAISIIMGANIGTCVTAQLVAFHIGDYAWIFVIIGFIMYFFVSKNEKVIDFGQAIFAFGILFTGLNLMADAMEPLAQSEVFSNLMLKVADVPILGVLLGAVMTTIVQSSSASIAVLQNLAATAGPDGVSSIIGLVGSIPILFGTNIGSTTTALLASIGGTINAKRTALSHVIFNTIGTLLFIWFTPYIAAFVEIISPQGDELDIISRQIANSHLCFNVATTLVFLPLIGVLANLVTKLIPGKEAERNPMEPLYLDYNVLEQPFVAIHLATLELHRMAEISASMLTETKKAFLGNSLEAANKVTEMEVLVNNLQDIITKYMSSIFSSEPVTEHQAKTISGLLHVVSDVEHIGDNCKNIAEFSVVKINKGYEFSDTACSEIYQCFDHSSKMVSNAIEAIYNGDMDLAKTVKEQEGILNGMEEKLRSSHMERLNNKQCSPEFTVIYTDVVHNIEKIGDSCDNIANVVLDKVKMPAEKERF
ncbi:MAG: Na/Pi cotransporter family protein [Clostridiales bacterium]|nr:Na/Pi cotransporter family protein [Clostridiales bacterium]